MEVGGAVAAEAVDFEMAGGVGEDGGVRSGEEWEAAEEGLGFVGVFGGEGVDFFVGAVDEHFDEDGDVGGGLAVGGEELSADGGVVGGELEAEVAVGVGAVPEGPGEAVAVGGGGAEGGAFPGGGHGGAVAVAEAGEVGFVEGELEAAVGTGGGLGDDVGGVFVDPAGDGGEGDGGVGERFAGGVEDDAADGDGVGGGVGRKWREV